MDSSTDSSGVRGKAVAAGPPVAPTPAAGDGDRDDGAQADPWFTPGPKRTVAAADGDESADWFLRTGRAGLLPDSMTESWQDGTLASPDRLGEGEGTASPPWGTEPTQAADGVPPPWEIGPWPGPRDVQPASRPGPQAASRPGPPAASSEPAESSGVLPSSRRLVQLALAAGIGVVVLVVIIVVIVTGTSGGPGGCGTYPAAVRQAYARALTDLRKHAPASAQSAALAQAASLANTSAAATGQIGVRTALFAMAGDLDRAHADVMANRAVPAALLQRLTADGSALPASCSS